MLGRKLRLNQKSDCASLQIFNKEDYRSNYLSIYRVDCIQLCSKTTKNCGFSSKRHVNLPKTGGMLVCSADILFFNRAKEFSEKKYSPFVHPRTELIRKGIDILYTSMSYIRKINICFMKTFFICMRLQSHVPCDKNMLRTILLNVFNVISSEACRTLVKLWSFTAENSDNRKIPLADRGEPECLKKALWGHGHWEWYFWWLRLALEALLHAADMVLKTHRKIIPKPLEVWKARGR